MPTNDQEQTNSQQNLRDEQRVHSGLATLSEDELRQDRELEETLNEARRRHGASDLDYADFLCSRIIEIASKYPKIADKHVLEAKCLRAWILVSRKRLFEAQTLLMSVIDAMERSPEFGREDATTSNARLFLSLLEWKVARSPSAPLEALSKASNHLGHFRDAIAHKSRASEEDLALVPGGASLFSAYYSSGPGPDLLVRSVIHDNIALSFSLLKLGVDINAKGSPGDGEESMPEGITPLMAAALKGSEGIINILLDKGADPMISTSEGVYALTFAIMTRRPECVSALLNCRHPSLTAPDHTGVAIPEIAAFHGGPEVVRVFFGNPDVNWNRPNVDGVPFLFIAMRKGDIEVMRVLLEKGVYNGGKFSGLTLNQAAKTFTGISEEMKALIDKYAV